MRWRWGWSTWPKSNHTEPWNFIFLWADETLRVNKASDWLQERKSHIQLLRNSRCKLIGLEWMLTSHLTFHDSAVKTALNGHGKKGLRGRNIWMSHASPCVCVCVCSWKSSSLLGLSWKLWDRCEFSNIHDNWSPSHHLFQLKLMSSFCSVEMSAIIRWIMWSRWIEYPNNHI